MTRQPIWKCVANLGDVNPVENGGLFVFVDTTGVYSPELEKWDEKWKISYRVILDQLVLHEGQLIPARIVKKYLLGEHLPRPIDDYPEWFDDSTDGAAIEAGIDPQELRQMFCETDVVKRAQAYRALYDKEGWLNGDGYPQKRTRREAEERYGKLQHEVETHNGKP